MLYLKIASRYLTARKSHAAVGVISAVSLAGIAVATAAIVCVLSVFNGFADLASDRLSLLSPDLKVYPVSGKTLQQASEITRKIEGVPGVERALPVVQEHALATYGNNQSVVTMKGVAPQYAAMMPVDSTVIDGQFVAAADSAYRYITLSVGAAVALEARPGYYDWLRLYVPKRRGRINPAIPMSAFRGDSLVVSGVFRLDQAEYDADMVIVPLSVARQLLEYTDDEASAIEVSVADGVSVRRIGNEIRNATGGRVKVLDRMEQEWATFNIINMEKWVTTLLLVFILLIASFNIVSTLSMLVIEKQRDIVTMQALGARESLIRKIFVSESTMLTLLGGFIGMILGVALCLAQQWGEFIKLSTDPSRLIITAYPVAVRWYDLVIITVALIFVSVLVGGITRLIVNRSLRHREVAA